jgi:predicted metal-dependent TIM-barrel fold hydrolase
MRRFFERPSVIGVGEIGLNNNTPNEMIGLEAQLDLAQELKLPALVHTPHVDKRRGVEMIAGLIEKRRDYKRELILIDHITEETIEIVRGMGVWVAMTVYPFSKLSPERAVAMVARYGLDKIMVNSSVDWGESDPLSVPKVVRLMRREGWKERDIEQLVWKNPVRFWGQSGRLAETEEMP